MCVVIASSPTHFSYFRIPFRHLKFHSGIEIPFRRKNFEKFFQKKSFGLECVFLIGMYDTFRYVSQFVPKNLATGC